MSNIIPIFENQALHSQSTLKKTTDTSFQDSLNKALEAKTAPQPSAAAPALGEIQAPAFIPVAPPEAKVITQTSRLLDLLSEYANDLEDTSKSLRDIEPLVNTIRNHADDLLKETETMDAPDETLRKIASEVALTARLESMKFNRGDYI